MSAMVWGAIIALLVFIGYRAVKSKRSVLLEQHQLAQAFLEENRQRGVKESASGLQYEVLKEGTGQEHPSAYDRVLVHYHGTLISGQVFDSSVQRGEPISFGLDQVIPGWTEGLQFMVEGEKARFYIPSNLAYGNQAVGSIPPGSLLIFEVELLKIER